MTSLPVSESRADDEVSRAAFSLLLKEPFYAHVLAGSCLEHIESRWVNAEWDSFLEEIRTGRKQGELFIINCGTLKLGTLPLFLRRHQMFNDDYLGLEQLAKYVRMKLPQRVTLDDHIRLSLHCRNPKKNEDKIYLVTAHSPDGAGMNIAAHWGPWKAKRLASQLKAMNLESEAEVCSLVENLKKEKTSTSYRPVPHAKLLTRGARDFLEANLGLTAGSKVFATPGGARIDENRSHQQPKQQKPKLPEKPSPKRGSNRLRKRTVKRQPPRLCFLIFWHEARGDAPIEFNACQQNTTYDDMV